MTEAERMGEMSGRVLEGAYRITRLIGKGGMGGVRGCSASSEQARGHQAHVA